MEIYVSYHLFVRDNAQAYMLVDNAVIPGKLALKGKAYRFYVRMHQSHTRHRYLDLSEYAWDST